MYQKLIVVGNLGNDPEMRYMPDGTAVTNFSVASTRTWKVEGEQKKETTWFRVSTWRGLAETCNEWLSKGKKVLVEGRLTVDKDTGGPKMFTRQDGSVGTNFEMTADTVRFLSGRDEVSGDYESNEVKETEEDDIPF